MVRKKIHPVSGTGETKSNTKAMKEPSRYRYVLAGIVAGGRGCGRPNTPGVYVDPQKHLSWIINTIERN